MNIAIFSDSYLPQVNGVASSLGLLKEQFLSLGHQVTIFIPEIEQIKGDSKDVVQIKSIKIRENPTFYIGSPFSLRMLNLLRDGDFDIIHAHTPLTMGILAYQASNFFKKPLIYTYHTMLPGYLHYIGCLSKTKVANKIIKKFDLYSCNVCDLVIAPSLKAKNFLKDVGISTTSEVVPNGVNLQQFKGAKKGYLRSRPDIKATDKILLFVGRLAPEKNPYFLIKMFAQLSRQIQDVKLVFAGSGYLLPELRHLVDELQLGSNILFLGDVLFDDMPALYADVDIFVSAATTEIHPMTLLEAIASGLPVVVSNDDAFVSAVINGENGFLSGLDEQIFANRVLEILQNPLMWQTMSEQSLKISQQFSVETQANRLLAIYSDLVAQHNK